MTKEIRDRLAALAEDSYREFSAGLIPDSAKPLLGVRLPRLRSIAKELAKGDWQRIAADFDGENEDVYFEETMLRAMLIGYGTQKKEVTAQQGLSYLEMIIPHIDNWSLCDSFCNSFGFARRYPDELWAFLQTYLYSEREFEVRVGIILLLTQYLRYDADGHKRQRNREIHREDFAESAVNAERAAQDRERYPYLERILAALNRPFLQGYYAQMAAAWTTSEAFVYFPYETHKMLTEGNRMDNWTYNKALQKICESRNPDAAVRQYMKELKKT
ncbi:MAG: DNA alkylation repair protein [Roseburia sp.]|nr:DNA alkylation repair protein [Roseburia sp.]